MLVSIAAGLLLGFAVAGVNTAVTARAMRTGSSGALTGAVVIRTVLDLLALAAVFLTRNVLPIRFEPALLATAAGLSSGIIALSILTSRQKSRGDRPEKEDE